MTIRGVTGDMNTGKTYLCTMLQNIAAHKNITIKYISGDIIRRHILTHSTEEKDIEIRNKIIALFGEEIGIGGVIDRVKLGDHIFSNSNTMKQYEQIVLPRMRELLKSIICTSSVDIILLERAALIENNMIDIVNNNIIYTLCSKKTQNIRANESDLPGQQVQKRYGYFQDYTTKRKYLQQHKARVIEFDTSNNPDYGAYESLLNSLLYNA